MDYIFFEFLLVLKVKGRRSREIVDCPDCLEIQPVGEPRELWGWKAGWPGFWGGQS